MSRKTRSESKNIRRKHRALNRMIHKSRPLTDSERCILIQACQQIMSGNSYDFRFSNCRVGKAWPESSKHFGSYQRNLAEEYKRKAKRWLLDIDRMSVYGTDESLSMFGEYLRLFVPGPQWPDLNGRILHFDLDFPHGPMPLLAPERRLSKRCESHLILSKDVEKILAVWIYWFR
jgi:hypothetical protein